MVWLIIGAAAILLFAVPGLAIGHLIGLVLRLILKRP